MKHNLLIAVFAIVAVAASVVFFSAFTQSEQTVSFEGEKWFEFTDALEDGDVNNPANYMITGNDGTDTPDCPEGTAVRCAVLAQPGTNPNQPDLSEESVEDIRLKAIE